MAEKGEREEQKYLYWGCQCCILIILLLASSSSSSSFSSLFCCVFIHWASFLVLLFCLYPTAPSGCEGDRPSGVSVQCTMYVWSGKGELY